ncbi:hypothetical protein HZH66_013687 [Vespula vulgaris]|uniref:Uncharacterized protein n=1 Tax=Vespula vulgaris TaxID=7454 RepID=A0A834J695_VESVU|nr:hypothetical protein HZH66_013687 [Vespula vulgaris]
MNICLYRYAFLFHQTTLVATNRQVLDLIAFLILLEVFSYCKILKKYSSSAAITQFTILKFHLDRAKAHRRQYLTITFPCVDHDAKQLQKLDTRFWIQKDIPQIKRNQFTTKEFEYNNHFKKYEAFNHMVRANHQFTIPLIIQFYEIIPQSN